MKSVLTTALLAASIVATVSVALPSSQDLENSFSKGQWNETAEISHEILLRDASSSLPKIRGAYALFQLGYSNSALYFLKKLNPEQWHSLPKGVDRLVEIVSLFEKKVPLSALPSRMSQVRLNDASPHLHDEIQFALGREAYERGDTANAKRYLETVSGASRFWSEARYLLGSLAVTQKQYSAAANEFSKIFQPAIFDQSTEFWRDFSTEMTSHWGPSLKVMLDTSIISKTRHLGELAQLAAARIAYATKTYDKAVEYYDRLDPNSPYYPRASLEKIWALLALNQHSKAEQVAASLEISENSPESIEARPLRALILTDAGRTADARKEIDNFITYYEKAKEQLIRFRSSQDPAALPTFLAPDLQQDARLDVLVQYTDALKFEIAKLRSEDRQVFPVFQFLAGNLEPLLLESKARRAQLTEEHINLMLAKLERLYVQSKLIKAETFLEDREQLRTEFRNVVATDESRQKEHDFRLAQLLQSAVHEVDEATAKVKMRHLNLEFRQAELLWELSSAEGIISQTSGKKADEERALSYKRRALTIAQDIVQNAPNFKNYPGALFFAGFAELDLGQENLGVQELQAFLRKYPKHNHAPDAYRMLADREFDSGRAANAEALYKKILDFPNSPIMGYALYKLGWCAYARKDFSRALLGLEQAVLWSDQWEKTSQLLTLQREAKRDLISIYAEVGDYHKAPEYFQKFLKGESAPWILDLAKQLDNSGQFEKSAELYHFLMNSDPTNPENLGYSTLIVWGAYKLHNWSNVSASMKQLVDRYRPTLSDVQTEDRPSYRTEKALREVVLAAHTEFQASISAEDLRRLGELDDMYLSTFSAWPGYEAPLYQHADLLLRRKDYMGAVAAYRNHWTRFEAKLDPTFREESLRNLIHAIEQIDNKEEANGAVLSAPAAEITAYIEEYKKSYPNSKYIRPIAYLGSAIYFKYNQGDKGIVDSQKVFDYNPRDVYGKKAFQNLRTAYYRRNDWELTYKWASELAARKYPGMEAYADDLRTIRRESLFLWAEGTKDDLTAANLYMQIARSADMQPLWSKSLYNAFVRFQKANHRIEALQAGAQLEEIFPNFEGLGRIAGLRAAMLQEAGNYTSAYPLLIQFLKSDKESPKEAIEQGRLNAGLIAEATGNAQDAGTLFHEYAANAPKSSPAGVAEANRAMARLQYKQGRSLASLSPRWEKLLREQADYQKVPIPSQGSLADRIGAGGVKLESLSRQLFEVSNDPKVSDDVAFEAYCAVPFLYGSYEKALQDLSMTLSASLRTEIGKISSPVGAKAKSLGEECLKKSVEAEHDGPIFRRVNQRWGWQWDPILSQRAQGLLVELMKHYPWAEPAPLGETEAGLIKRNLSNQGNEDSWYSLARIRCEQKQFGLCRLTVVDALNRNPQSGKLLNMLGILQEGTPEGAHLSSIFERAAHGGAPSAWGNLAVYHLKGGRLTQSLEALKQGLQAGVFESDPPLKALVKEWTKS